MHVAKDIVGKSVLCQQTYDFFLRQTQNSERPMAPMINSAPTIMSTNRPGLKVRSCVLPEMFWNSQTKYILFSVQLKSIKLSIPVLDTLSFI